MGAPMIRGLEWWVIKCEWNTTEDLDFYQSYDIGYVAHGIEEAIRVGFDIYGHDDFNIAMIEVLGDRKRLSAWKWMNDVIPEDPDSLDEIAFALGLDP